MFLDHLLCAGCCDTHSEIKKGKQGRACGTKARHPSLSPRNSMITFSKYSLNSKRTYKEQNKTGQMTKLMIRNIFWLFIAEWRTIPEVSDLKQQSFTQLAYNFAIWDGLHGDSWCRLGCLHSRGLAGTANLGHMSGPQTWLRIGFFSSPHMAFHAVSLVFPPKWRPQTFFFGNLASYMAAGFTWSTKKEAARALKEQPKIGRVVFSAHSHGESGSRSQPTCNERGLQKGMKTRRHDSLEATQVRVYHKSSSQFNSIFHNFIQLRGIKSIDDSTLGHRTCLPHSTSTFSECWQNAIVSQATHWLLNRAAPASKGTLHPFQTGQHLGRARALSSEPSHLLQSLRHSQEPLVVYPSFNTGRKKTHSGLAPAPSSAICHILVSPRRHPSSVLHSPILGELEQKIEFPVFRTTLRSLCSIYDPLVFSISPTGHSRPIWPECQVGW